MIVAVKQKGNSEIELAMRVSAKIAKRLTLKQLGFSDSLHEIIFLSEMPNLKMPFHQQNDYQYPFGITPINIPQGISHILISADIKGIGDVKSRLVAIQSLRKQRPDIDNIGYLGPKTLIDILLYHPGISYQISSEQEIPHGAFIADLKDAAARWEGAKGPTLTESREEIYTRMLGLQWQQEKPCLYLSREEMQFGHDFVGKTTKPRIGVTLRTAETWKDWPHVEAFIDLADAEYEIFVFDQSIKLEGVRNVVGFSLREVMAILCYMDCVISPDTAIHHFCEALDVPCIALFGSMDTERYRNRGYICSVDYLQGECPHRQKPCMYSICAGKGNFQPCMDWFKPEFVFQKVKEKITYGTITKNRNIFGGSL